MTYIEPITDPKILKLGIKWALYREKKPDYREVVEHDYLEPYNDTVKKWHEQSRIAYPKEPEFKVGDIVYLLKPKIILEVECHSGKIYSIDKLQDIGVQFDNVGGVWFNNENQLSHYYSGQEVESFKYVRKVEHNYTDIDAETPNEYFYHADADLTEWQEVEEPNVENYLHFSSDRQYKVAVTQFQEDVNKAKILAEI